MFVMIVQGSVKLLRDGGGGVKSGWFSWCGVSFIDGFRCWFVFWFVEGCSAGTSK